MANHRWQRILKARLFRAWLGYSRSNLQNNKENNPSSVSIVDHNNNNTPFKQFQHNLDTKETDFDKPTRYDFGMVIFNQKSQSLTQPLNFSLPLPTSPKSIISSVAPPFPFQNGQNGQNGNDIKDNIKSPLNIKRSPKALFTKATTKPQPKTITKHVPPPGNSLVDSLFHSIDSAFSAPQSRAISPRREMPDSIKKPSTRKVHINSRPSTPILQFPSKLNPLSPSTTTIIPQPTKQNLHLKTPIFKTPHSSRTAPTSPVNSNPTMTLPTPATIPSRILAPQCYNSLFGSKLILPTHSGEFYNGECGLRNLGNSCFLNAIVQALAHTIHFRTCFANLEQNHLWTISASWIAENKKAIQLPRYSDSSKQSNKFFPPPLLRQPTENIYVLTNTRRGYKKHVESSGLANFSTLTLEIHNLLRILWSKKFSVVAPHSLLSCVWKLCPSFRGYRQHDAAEFLMTILDQIHNEWITADKFVQKHKHRVRSRKESEPHSPDNLHLPGEEEEEDESFRGSFRQIGGKFKNSEKIISTTLPVKFHSPPSRRKRRTYGTNGTGSENPHGSPDSHILIQHTITENDALSFASPIDFLFKGSSVSTVFCQNCFHPSTTVESYTSVNLDIPTSILEDPIYHREPVVSRSRRRRKKNLGNSTDDNTNNGANVFINISILLDEYFASEPLCDGEPIYNCSNCSYPNKSDPEEEEEYDEIINNRRSKSTKSATTARTAKSKRIKIKVPASIPRSATKQVLLKKSPFIFVITLSRFRWNVSGGGTKMQHHVEFPLVGLDLTPYFSPSSPGIIDPKDYIYDLHAVVLHHGDTLESGHYSCIVFNSATQSWMICNDDRVFFVSEDTVINPPGDPYILFYNRRNRLHF